MKVRDMPIHTRNGAFWLHDAIRMVRWSTKRTGGDTKEALENALVILGALNDMEAEENKNTKAKELCGEQSGREKSKMNELVKKLTDWQTEYNAECAADMKTQNAVNDFVLYAIYKIVHEG